MKKLLFGLLLLTLNLNVISQTYEIGMVCTGLKSANSLDPITKGISGYNPYTKLNYEVVLTDSTYETNFNGQKSVQKIVEVSEEDFKIIMGTDYLCDCKLFDGKIKGDVGRLLNPIALDVTYLGTKTKMYIVRYEINGTKKGYNYTHVFISFLKINTGNVYSYSYGKLKNP